MIRIQMLSRFGMLRLLVPLAASLLTTATAATYHVAQEILSASDDSPGDSEHPLKTISKAAELLKAGELVIIHSGVYRERVQIKASGTAQQPIRIEAAEGEHVVLTGADRITNWKKVDGANPIFSTDWPHKFITWNSSMTHPNDAYHQVIGRCEQVIINGYLQRQVLSSNLLSPGTFFADVTNRTLFVWDATNADLKKQHVEASTRQEILRLEGDYVQVRGLTFRYAANMAQHGAIVLAGRFDTLEDCVVESMNSSGASFQGEDAVVRRCTFRDNGQLGYGASRAHRLLFTECVVENNNTKNFDRGWEAGGDKHVLCRDAVLERSCFLRNRGNGIWFDIGNTNCTVRNCLIAENEDAGIFYEISFALQAHDNVIVKNGFAATGGAWGAQTGISLSSSPGCLIERNIIAANREGLNFREQTRESPLIEDRKSHPIWNHDQLVRNNIITLNRDAQIWGWFDVKDNRHWPSSNGSKDLTLQKLNLKFENNIYFALPNQGWFKWGPTWSPHEVYPSLSQFQEKLRIDSGSETVNPRFGDLRALDLRIAASDEKTRASYPHGEIPRVILEIR
jgi:hypothetical protein